MTMANNSGKREGDEEWVEEGSRVFRVRAQNVNFLGYAVRDSVGVARESRRFGGKFESINRKRSGAETDPGTAIAPPGHRRPQHGQFRLFIRLIPRPDPQRRRFTP